MEFIVDFANYPNITLGDMGKPPYTLDQYERANQNSIEFQKIFDQAESLGVSHLIFPKKQISVCYNSDKNLSRRIPLMYLCSDTTYSFNGLEFGVIYDSLNKSPYDKSGPEVQAWKLEGSIFSEKNSSKNINVFGLELKGEVYLRAFQDGTGINTEAQRESSCGFSVGALVNNLTFKGCNFRGFMAGGIAGIREYGDSSQVIGLQNTPTAVYDPGYYQESTNEIVPKSRAYISPFININLDRANAIWGSLKRFAYIRRTGGYNRTSNFSEDYFDVLFYDVNNNFIVRYKTSYMVRFNIPVNAAKYRLQIFGEDIGLGQYLEAKLAQHYLMIPPAGYVTIDDCTIADCHRGGLSNIAENLLINNTKFINNGGDQSSGRPLFESSTRYHINIEDIYGASLTVTNCDFVGNPNVNIIYGGLKGVFTGNRISGGNNAFGMYYNKNVVISSNLIEQCNVALLVTDDGPRIPWVRNILFTDNICTDIKIPCSRSNPIKGKSNIRIIDNIFNILLSETNVNMFNPIDTTYKNNSFNIREREDFTGTNVSMHLLNGDFEDNTVVFTPMKGSSRFFLFGISPDNTFKRNKLTNSHVYPNQYAANYVNSTTINVDKCTFDSTEGSDLRNSDLGVSANISVSSFPKPRLDVVYNECVFTNSRLVLPQFGSVPTTYKELHYKFKSCELNITGDVFRGSKPSFIGSNRSAIYNPLFEQYTVEFDSGCVFKIDEAVPDTFRLIWTTQGNRDFKVYVNGSDSTRRPLKIGGNVEV